MRGHVFQLKNISLMISSAYLALFILRYSEGLFFMVLSKFPGYFFPPFQMVFLIAEMANKHINHELLTSKKNDQKKDLFKWY